MNQYDNHAVPVVYRTPSKLRVGDIVRMHGGRFKVTSDPRESQAHRPEGYWPAGGVGPSDCHVVDSVCIEGSVPGYFWPGSDWVIQGNHLAQFQVEA